MKLKELITITDEKLQNIEITGITCNSLNVREGFAFVCINGTKTDGHKYAAQAVESGAAVIIAEKDTGVENQIIVDDTHKAFFDISAAWFGHPADKMKIVGVTGTNGKTSVTYMIKNILEKAGYKTGIIGTIQNMIGKDSIPSKNTTPDAYELNSLFSLMEKSGCQYVIMEVSSHALDQKRVCDITFEAAMFTNLTQDHLDYHITMENYFAAKKKLFQMCKTAIINIDDEYGKRLVAETDCKCITYSAKTDSATFTARDVKYFPDCISYNFTGYNLIKKIKVNTGGQFTVYNSLCAICCAIELGISIDVISDALLQMKGVKGRAESVPTGKDFTVIIDYAHTPDGLKNILKTFRECQHNRLTVLFGCGGDRDKTKRPKMGAIAVSFADNVIVTSDNPRSENPTAIINDILEGMKGTKKPYTVIENRIEAIKFAIANAQKGDIIVLAGKGHETYQILNTGTIHLDEREVVRDALATI